MFMLFLLLACGTDSGDTNSLPPSEDSPVFLELPAPDPAGPIYCIDQDGDGWGDGESLCGLEARDGYAPIGDCDDGAADRYPGGTEVCDGGDNNCDGEIDEGLGWMGYFDSDWDGYGEAGDPIKFCDPPGNVRTEIDGDCNDDDATIHPGAAEACDSIDQDCDGLVDEECPV